jgi:hypothetical protein
MTIQGLAYHYLFKPLNCQVFVIVPFNDIDHVDEMEFDHFEYLVYRRVFRSAAMWEEGDYIFTDYRNINMRFSDFHI